MAAGQSKEAEAKKLCFIFPGANPSPELDFPKAKVFESLGYSLEGLSFDQLQTKNPSIKASVIVFDYGLREAFLKTPELETEFCKQNKIVLWYCSEDLELSLESLEEAELSTLFYFFDNASEKNLATLIKLAQSTLDSEISLNREKLFASILANTEEALLGTNQEGIVLYANDQAVKLLSLSLARLRYQQISRFFILSDPQEEEDFENVLSYKILKRWDGQEIRVFFREQVLNESKEDLSRLILFQDISENYEKYLHLDKARKEAQRTAKAKSNYLANISHELRTPLNSIMGMAELALQKVSNKEQEEYLRILQISAGSLYQFVNTMLDYIRLEDGNISLKEKAFPLTEVLDSLSAQFAIQCHNKGLGFHLVADENIAAFYVGDATRLKQILINLISNAYKFTQKGEIVVRCRELPFEAEEGKNPVSSENDVLRKVYLEFQVLDTGTGIQVERQWEIFQPFVQLTQTEEQNMPGTGIGLTISKLLVDALKGKISLESEEGRGSIFSFTALFSRGVVRRKSEVNSKLSHIKTVLLLGSSWGWIDALSLSLKQYEIKVSFCRHAKEFESYLELADLKNLLLIFQGDFAEHEEVFCILSKPQYSSLAHRKHFLSLRLNFDAEDRWHSAPFPYVILYEPVRTASVMKYLGTLELELSDEERDSVQGQYHSPYDLTIFYVEDEAVSRARTTKILSEGGHRVELYVNGEQILKALNYQEPDLLLLDIEIPIFNGYEVVTRIRKGEFGEAKRNIPIIALTAHDTMAEKRQAEHVGIDAFLAKSFSARTLLMVLDRVWERFLEGKIGRSRRLVRQAEPLSKIQELIEGEEWVKAQALIQKYREERKGKLSKEVDELSFRLLLMIRRNNSAASLEVLEKIQSVLGEGA